MIRAMLIRLGASLKIQANKMATLLSPGVRQEDMATAIEVVTGQPAEEFLLDAMKMANENFDMADNSATKASKALKNAKTKVVVTETERARKKKQLATVINMVSKKKQYLSTIDKNLFLRYNYVVNQNFNN